MPDGAQVEMPDVIDPALGARLRSLHDTTPHEVTEGPQGFLNGVAEIAGKGIGNIPGAAAHGVKDLYSRIAHGQGAGPSAPTFPLSPNAKSVGQGIGDALGAASAPYQLPKAATEAVDQYVAPVVSDVGAIAPVAGAVGNMTGAFSAAEAAANAPDWARYGYRTEEAHPIAAGAAGSTGTQALTLQHQGISNTLAGAEAGVPHGTKLSYEALAKGQEAPNAVFGRVAAALPESPLSPAAQSMVSAVGDIGNRITKGTPNARANIGSLKEDFLAPDTKFSGNQIVNEMRGLRQEGYANIGSEDVSNQQLGKAQLDMSRALEQHVRDTLPTTADVSMDQLAAARTALAKNHAVQSALHGSNVDPAALARVQRADPDLLTGGLKTVADFTNEHPAISKLANSIESPPSFQRDLGKAIGGEHQDITGRLFRATGIGAGARRVLTGNPQKALEAAQRAPVTGLGDEFAPIDQGAPQPPPGLTAGPMGAPPQAPAANPGDIPLADLLSHGVEQPPTAGLSLGQAPQPTGIPFSHNAEHMAGDLSLADESTQASPFKGQPLSMSDFAGVKSQGVPEGIMQRAPGRAPSRLSDTIDFEPNSLKLERPAGKAFEPMQRDLLQNNASGESAASLEAQNRPKLNLVQFNGDTEKPILKDVTQADIEPDKGHVIIDRDTGRVVKSGKMAPNLVKGLLARWKNFQAEPKGGPSLADEFAPGG
jgi:hypothetical protein